MRSFKELPIETLAPEYIDRRRARKRCSYSFDPILEGQAVTPSFWQAINSLTGDQENAQNIPFQYNSGWIKCILFSIQFERKEPQSEHLSCVSGERLLPGVSFNHWKNLFYSGNVICFSWKYPWRYFYYLYLTCCFLTLCSVPGFCQSWNILRSNPWGGHLQMKHKIRNLAENT